jgi:hypothetical protein
MSRSQRLIYDFPTERHLQVQMDNGKWYRVTCDTFRSYFGPRRIDGMDFDGLHFYRTTNFIFQADLDAEFTYEILERSNIPKPQIQQTPRRLKRVGL